MFQSYFLSLMLSLFSCLLNESLKLSQDLYSKWRGHVREGDSDTLDLGPEEEVIFSSTACRMGVGGWGKIVSSVMTTPTAARSRLHSSPGL